MRSIPFINGWTGRSSGISDDTRSYRADALSYLTKIAGQSPADIVPLRLNGRPAYALFHPDLIRHVLVDRAESYVKTRKQRPLFGNSILTSEGEASRQQRVALQELFLPARLQALIPVIDEVTNRHFTAWEKQTTIEASHAISRLAIEISGKVIFGIDISPEAETLIQAIETLVKPGFTGLGNALGIPQRRAIRTVRGIVKTVIERGRRSRSFLIQLLTEKPMPGAFADHISTMLLGGYETLASHLSWTVHLLSVHTDVQARIRKDPGPHSAYLKAVVSESLRLCPPFWRLTREAIQADVIGKTPVEPGALIIICPYLLHRDPRYWSEGEVFRPERFFGGDRAVTENFTYLPFGAGPRACMGGAMARLESQTVLSRLLEKFEFSADGPSGTPDPHFTLRPKDPIQIRLRLRGGGR